MLKMVKLELQYQLTPQKIMIFSDAQCSNLHELKMNVQIFFGISNLLVTDLFRQLVSSEGSLDKLHLSAMINT